MTYIPKIMKGGAEITSPSALANLIQTNTVINQQEIARQTSETDRNTAETNRANSETTRNNQETTRQTNESTRQSQETTRQTQETTRQNYYNAYKTLETYNSSTPYIVGNKVTNQGGSYQCILNTTGNAPSFNSDNTWWKCIAAKGVDGAGGNMFTSVYDPNNKAQDIYAHDTKDDTVTFTEAITDSDIASNEKHSTMFGKILKSIKTLRSKIGDTALLTTTSNTDLVGAVNEVNTNKLNKSNLATATTGQVLTKNSDGTASFQNAQGGISQSDLIQSDNINDSTKPPSASVTNGLANKITAVTTQENWITATLLNSWTNLGSGYASASYFKDTLGMIHLRGLIKGGTVTSGTILFTLPVGYRPSATQTFPTYCSSGSGILTTTVEIDASGNVKLGNTAANTYLMLDPITSFRADSASTLSPAGFHEIVVKANGTVGVDCNYTNIKSALDSITDNSYVNRYRITVKNGTYEINGLGVSYLGLKSYVDIVGQSKTGVIVKHTAASMDDTKNVFDMNGYTNFNGESIIRNMTIISYNCKAPFHCDRDVAYFQGTVTLEDCILINNNKFSGSSNHNCVACGLYAGQNVFVKNCMANGFIWAHNGYTDNVNNGSSFIVENCVCEYLWIATLGSNTKDYCRFRNNKCEYIKLVYADYANRAGTQNILMSWDIELEKNDFKYIVTSYENSSAVSIGDFWDALYNGVYAVMDNTIHDYCYNNTGSTLTKGTYVDLSDRLLKTIVTTANQSTAYGVVLKDIPSGSYGVVQYAGNYAKALSNGV